MSRVESSFIQTQDTTYIDLSRLLNRLEQALLQPDVDPRLRKSSIQRTKASANVEHARSLLLRLEHENSANKVPSQKASIQSDLQRKRALLKQLQNRLYELNQLDDAASLNGDAGSDSEETDSDTEELINRYAPALNSTSGAIHTDQGDGAPYLDQNQAAAAVAAATLSSTLRARGARGETASNAPSAMTTGSSSSSAPLYPKPGSSTSPFAPKPTAAAPAPAQGANETLLNYHGAEQETLTNSLLTLATALKNSTNQFSTSLTASDPTVDQAAKALDKSSQGMESAGRRMGTLRRMTEGKGWWARMSLYAWVAVGWVVAILVVFVMPKLRF